jgi:Domain of unknown function (DUF4252)
VKRTAVLMLAIGLSLAAQQFKFNFDQLAAKASDRVDLSLNGQTLQFAAKFLDDKDADEAKVRKLIAGLEGIYIRSFEFNKDGVWTQADVDGVRNQLHAPEWSRILGYKGEADGETSEVYVRYQDKKITGVAILVAEPRQFTVVNIAGPVDLDSLADLSGHFGVPKLERRGPDNPKAK